MPTNGRPGLAATLAALRADWNGTSNHYAGPLSFSIAGINTGDFTANGKGFMAAVDVLGPKGTG